jgi:C_GCAxxG_C_C family probable redox protein
MEKEKMSKSEKIEKRGDQAKELFLSGYNCSQAIVSAFSDRIGGDADWLRKAVCGYGGGVGRLRQTCGAFLGAVFVLNLLYGYPTTGKNGEKAEQYARIQELAKRVQAQNGSLCCRELLGSLGDTSPIPEERTPAYYQKRPCAEIICKTAEALELFLQDLEEKDSGKGIK